MLLEKDFQQILPNNVGARRKMISRQKMLLQIQDSTAKPSTKASTNVSGMSLMGKNSLDGMPAGHCGACVHYIGPEKCCDSNNSLCSVMVDMLHA